MCGAEETFQMNENEVYSIPTELSGKVVNSYGR